MNTERLSEKNQKKLDKKWIEWESEELNKKDWVRMRGCWITNMLGDHITLRGRQEIDIKQVNLSYQNLRHFTYLWKTRVSFDLRLTWGRLLLCSLILLCISSYIHTITFKFVVYALVDTLPLFLLCPYMYSVDHSFKLRTTDSNILHPGTTGEGPYAFLLSCNLGQSLSPY
jgi:hypothetical protein